MHRFLCGIVGFTLCLLLALAPVANAGSHEHDDLVKTKE